MEKQCNQCQEVKEVKWFTKTRSATINREAYYRGTCKQCEAENKGDRKVREVVYRISNIEAAYIAGLFDGEGHVGLYERSKKKKSNRLGAQGTSYNIRIQITSTDNEIIEWLKSKFGGLSYVTEHDHKNDDDPKRNVGMWKNMYQFLMTGRNAVGFMKCVLPYTIIKKKRIEVALAYIDTMGYSGMDIPEKLVNKRRELYNQLKSLNKRGKV